MKISSLAALGIAGALLCAFAVQAASTNGGVSATCKDGSSWSGKSHSGACRGHGGVQSWSDSGTSATAQTATTEATTSTRKSHSKNSESATTSGGMSSSMSSNTGATASVTATCKDGTTWTGKSHSGACRGHKGVQSWSNAGTAAATPAATPAAPPPVAAPVAKSTPMQPVANTAPASRSRTASAAQTAAPGGGPGQVWVNASTKVYHCSNDRWYGKTKNGQYMSESQAKAQGFRPDHGKACS